jgi:hypothetical protein
MALFRRSSPQPEAPLPYAPDSPEGLAARWVRWAASISINQHPVDDPTGALAGVNQPDDVWFLAGTFGGRAERRCAVPVGRPLFLPVFNIWYVNSADAPTRLEQAFGTLRVNNEPVAVEEIATPLPFNVFGARRNPVTGGTRPAPVTVWGLWKRLDPLPPGGHMMLLHGGDGHGFTTTVDYRLTVT